MTSCHHDRSASLRGAQPPPRVPLQLAGADEHVRPGHRVAPVLEDDERARHVAPRSQALDDGDAVDRLRAPDRRPPRPTAAS